MQHTSVKLNAPIEFINVEPLNPLITKCQIKVCYVGQDPNRNGSVITKEVATEMANTLPGCPIVGFYNETKEDFEGHNKIIDISDGQFRIKDTTQPYGFIPLEAKVWFQKFYDDGSVEHEYLVTEGYLWTGQFPECQRILTKGNNQSMELDEQRIKGHWTEDENGGPELFIINEAIISKLCILGEDVEPCFEGANITSVQFSFEEGFKEKLYSMMNELKELLQEGGAKQVFNRYSVEVGDALWTALYELANGDSIIEVCEEENQLFAVLKNSDEKYYRIDFSYSESEGLVAKEPVDLTDYELSEEPQFSDEEIQNFISNYEKIEDENDEKDPSNSEDKSEEEENEEEEKDEKGEYSLEDIPEYNELLSKFSALEDQYNELTAEKAQLESQVSELMSFKAQIERKDKEDLIAKFYMLNDEDKKDVIDNIDSYSLDEIEAKLCIICVRNKVNFNEEEKDKDDPAMLFNLNNHNEDEDLTTPAWVKAALEVEKNMK